MTQDQAPSRPQFRSDLAQTPIAQVLATVRRYRVPGVIECTRGDETKKIYIDGPNIIFASSSNTADSLGDRLLKQGRITQQQYDESVRTLGESGKRQGTILAEMGALDRKELFVAVREQVQAIVWSIFGWDSGVVTFQPGGRDKRREFIKIEIPIHRAVLEGMRYADAREMLSRIGPRITILEPNPEAERFELTLTEEEESLLQQVDGKRSLGELIQSPRHSAADNARLLYAFYTLWLVRPKAPKQIKVQIRSAKS